MSELQDKILDAALPHIPFDGWSLSTLERAAESIGQSAFDVKRAFPEGVMDAIRYFSARADEQLRKTLEKDYHLASMKIRERIATAVMARLRIQQPRREAVRSALGLYALPWNIPAATRTLYGTVDTIWRAAGDTSTDYNFYTKRLLLGKVYAATVRVWLEDKSPNLEETEAFLRRRIEDVMQIEKFKAKAKEGLQKLTGAFSPR